MRSAALALLLLLTTTAAHAQLSCAPELFNPTTTLQQSRVYWITVAPEAQGYLPNVQTAVDYWNSIFADYGIMFQLSGSAGGDFTITVGPAIDHTFFAFGTYGEGIEINPAHSPLDQEGLNVALTHELGHVASFRDVNTSFDVPCKDWTVMWLQVEYFNLMRTYADAFAVSRYYASIPPDEGEEPPACTEQNNCVDDGGPESPLIIDIDGDGIPTSTRTEGVPFDINADGALDLTAWTLGQAEDAFLWTDLNGDGRVNNGAELFGSNTSIGRDAVAENGFIALALYDTVERGGNSDGQISNRDPIWSHLWLWTDRNHDGVSQRAEIEPMHRSGVRELYVGYEVNPVEDVSGNSHLRGTCLVHEQGGGSQLSVRPMHDVFFAVDTH